MNINLCIFSGLAVLFYFASLAILLKRGALMLRYSLLWIFCGFMMTIVVVCPQILESVSKLMGVQVPSNALFILLIGFIVFLIMALTVIVSFQKKRLKMLSQAIALLENEIEVLKNKEVICR